MLRQPLLPRRAVLGMSAGISLGLVGCDAGTPLAPAPVDTGAPDRVESDVALVVEVMRATSAAAGVVRAQRRGFPRLRAELRDWDRLHVQHARALGEPLAPVRALIADDVSAARDAVTAAESRLRRHLTRACVQAEDGELALLLGSMAAAVAQREAAS